MASGSPGERPQLRRLGRLGCLVFAVSAAISVAAFFLTDVLVPCRECELGNPDAAAMHGLTAVLVGLAGFVGGLVVTSLAVLTVHLWRTRPDEPEWP